MAERIRGERQSRRVRGENQDENTRAYPNQPEVEEEAQSNEEQMPFDLSAVERRAQEEQEQRQDEADAAEQKAVEEAEERKKKMTFGEKAAIGAVVGVGLTVGAAAVTHHSVTKAGNSVAEWVGDLLMAGESPRHLPSVGQATGLANPKTSKGDDFAY